MNDFKKVNENVQKKICLGWSWQNEKKRTYFVIFSNAFSILELMLCNQNIPNLVYQTSLSFDGRA